MKITSINQIPGTVTNKKNKKKYSLDRLFGEDCAVYTRNGCQLLVQFRSPRRWDELWEVAADPMETI